MILLITTNEQLKQANSAVVHDLDIESLLSYLDDARFKHLLPLLGAATYQAIAGIDDADENLTSLLTIARKAEAILAIAYYTNMGSVKLSENGVHVYQSDNNRIASDRKVAALVNQSLLDGYAAMETLLLHLEDKLEVFTTYADSNERKGNRSLFANFAYEFNEALYINNNALLFSSLKSYLRDAETEHIEPLLGDEFTAYLRAQVAANRCSEKEKLLLKHINKVTAQFAMANAIPYRAVNLDANGIFTNTVGLSAGGGNAELQQPASDKRLTMAMTACEMNGNKAMARLRKFISTNAGSFAACKPVVLNTRSTLNEQPRGFFFV